jgi:TetR/AcrR family transcriptional regulator
MSQTTPSRTQADRSADTRGRILEAAVNEFANYGLAGARTDRIAQAAQVNKALLYYYFESKDKLYLAAFEKVAAEVRDDSMSVYSLDASAGERLLRIGLKHFDRLLSQNEFQTMLQQEMVRLHKGESSTMPETMKRFFTPVLKQFREIVREGVAKGELIDVDWLQVHIATFGLNVFYFMSSQFWKHVLPSDPLAPDEIAKRRAAIVRFLGLTVFNDRQHGTDLAERVLADTPMPAPGNRGFFRSEHERAQ